MSLLIVEYDTSTGEIIRWRYEHDESYTPINNEVSFDASKVSHENLIGSKIDTSTENLTEDPNFKALEDIIADFKNSNPTNSEQHLFNVVQRLHGDEIEKRMSKEKKRGPPDDV